MKAWFSPEPTRLEVLRQITKDVEPKVRVLYADCEPFPTKADVDLRMADAQNARDVREEMRANEQERQRHESKVVSIRVGSVRS